MQSFFHVILDTIHRPQVMIKSVDKVLVVNLVHNPSTLNALSNHFAGPLSTDDPSVQKILLSAGKRRFEKYKILSTILRLSHTWRDFWTKIHNVGL